MSSFCKACNAELLWAKTATGKAMPLNHDPDSGGNVELRNGIAYVMPKDQLPRGERYMPHHATCPAVDRFRMPRP